MLEKCLLVIAAKTQACADVDACSGLHWVGGIQGVRHQLAADQALNQRLAVGRREGLAKNQCGNSRFAQCPHRIWIILQNILYRGLGRFPVWIMPPGIGLEVRQQGLPIRLHRRSAPLWSRDGQRSCLHRSDCSAPLRVESRLIPRAILRVFPGWKVAGTCNTEALRFSVQTKVQVTKY